MSLIVNQIVPVIWRISLYLIMTFVVDKAHNFEPVTNRWDRLSKTLFKLCVCIYTDMHQWCMVEPWFFVQHKDLHCLRTMHCYLLSPSVQGAKCEAEVAAPVGKQMEETVAQLAGQKSLAVLHCKAQVHEKESVMQRRPCWPTLSPKSMVLIFRHAQTCTHTPTHPHTHYPHKHTHTHIVPLKHPSTPIS